MSELTPDQRLVEQQTTIPFTGLKPEDAEAMDIPRPVERKLGIDDETESLTEVVEVLPEADFGDLRSANEFVNEDGTLDTDALDAVDGLNLEAAANALDVTPEDVTDAQKYQPLIGSQEVVDKRREALAALGYRVKYQWNITSHRYAIINPDHVCDPAIQTFKDFNEGSDAFGWLSFRDYGGTVDLYVMFLDETVDTPDGLDYELYLGYHMGYGFDSSRKLFVNHFGFYPKGEGKGTRFYNIGNSHSRKHLGDPTNDTHERDNDRLPIAQWWNEGHKEFLQDDQLTQAVQNAENIQVNFEDKPFELYDFYRLLGIPASQAEDAVARVNAQTNGRAPTMWELGISLSFTLASEFSGHKSGAVFRARSRTATKLIKAPDAAMTEALREYEAGGIPDEESDETTDTGGQEQLDIVISDIESPEDLAEIDGISVGDLSTSEKGALADAAEQSLLNTFS